MPDINVETARRILDALAVAVDGKPSSAKTFSPVPYSDLVTYEDWRQEDNDSQAVTPRTRALLLAYLMLSGGRIPYAGIPVNGAWFRPDAWVAGSLVKLGYMTADDNTAAFTLTQSGWELAAEALEAAE